MLISVIQWRLKRLNNVVHAERSKNRTILLPTVTEEYYNLQEELDNIIISNTTQDLELLQLETRMGAAEGSITTLGAGLLLLLQVHY